jgi:hypothetical protein
MIDRSNPADRRRATQSEAFEVRHMQATDAFGYVTDRVSFRRITEALRIRESANAG